MTSSFSETKGVFCFSFNKRSLEDALGKIDFFFIRNISKRKQASGKKHAEHCLRHLNKTACEILSVFDKVLFCVKYLTPFFHRTLQLMVETRGIKMQCSGTSVCTSRKVSSPSSCILIIFCTLSFLPL